MPKQLYIFLSLITQISLCQNTFIKYYNKFNTGDKISTFDVGQKLFELNEGYILMGWKEEKTLTSQAPLNDTTRPMFLNIDKQGNVLSNKRYDNKTCNFGLGGTFKNSNNEYISVGGTLSTGDTCGYSTGNPYILNPKLYFQKTNSNGDLIWQKNFGNFINKNIIGADVITQTKDGNYFIVGSNNYYTWLLKMDEQGDTLWTKQYQSLYNRFSVLIANISDGYLIFSYQGSLVTKIDEQGNLIWTKNIPVTYGSIRICKDEGYIFVSNYQVSAKVYTKIQKLDKDLNFLWEKSYLVNGIYAVCETNDGNFILGNKDFTKVSPDGNIIWNKRFWGESNVSPAYYIYDVIQTSDGGYLATGIYEQDAFLIKTDCNGNIEWDTNSCLLPTDKDVLVFPNPTSEFITFQLPYINKDIAKITIKITDMLGQILVNNTYIYQNIITLNLQNYAQGIYIYSVFVNDQIYKSSKIIKQ